MQFFCAAAAVLLGGALLSFLLCGSRSAANAIGPLTATLGSALALAAGIQGLAGSAWSLTLAWTMPGAELRLAMDPLTALFLLPGGILGMAAAVAGRPALKAHNGPAGVHWGFFNLTLAAAAVMFAARDAMLFLLAWETMSVASFFCITLNDQDERVRSAGWMYFVAAHLGAAALVALFLLLGAEAGSPDFAAFGDLHVHGPLLPAAAFLLALVGFGSKAGFAPMHVWLPEAHPAAPSHVSAYLSGALIKAGLYGFLRTLTFLGQPQGWWGPLCLALGAAGALIGILMALGQTDLKRLLAYSSVENMGIMLMGVGIGLTGMAGNSPLAAGLGFGGALLHMLNHCLMKGQLFLAAGSVLHGAGTADMNRLGGLLKRMPLTGALFFAGAVCVCGLPPGNAFLSELLLYVAAAAGAKGMGTVDAALLWGSVVALALTGGLASFALVRAFGLSFLGSPRSGFVEHAHEPGIEETGPVAALAGLCALSALTTPLVFTFIWPATAQLAPMGFIPTQLGVSVLGYASLACAGLAGLVIILSLVRRAILARRPVSQSPTWGCGYTAPTERMQYSPASFAATMTSLAHTLTGHRETASGPSGYFPAAGALVSACRDRIMEGFYAPLFTRTALALDFIKALQHGKTQIYILYILAALLIVLAWRIWLP